MARIKLYTFDEVCSAMIERGYRDRNSVSARLSQLRHGWSRTWKRKDGSSTTKHHDPVLVEGVDFEYFRATIVYTESGYRKILELTQSTEE